MTTKIHIIGPDGSHQLVDSLAGHEDCEVVARNVTPFECTEIVDGKIVEAVERMEAAEKLGRAVNMTREELVDRLEAAESSLVTVAAAKVGL